MRFHELDEQGHGAFAWELGDGEDGVLPDVVVGVLVDGAAQLAGGFRAGLLSQPEDGVAPHFGFGVVARERN